MTYAEFKSTHREPTTCKSIRTLSGLSQMAFAAKYGIPRRSVENWETGERAAPDYVLSLLLFAVMSDTTN